MSTESRAQPDDTVVRVSEVALRMMAGAVSPQKLRELQDLVQRSPDLYPWQEVVDAVVQESVDVQAMVQDGIIAQRNWLARGGREVPAAKNKRRSLKGRAKRGLAFLIVRSGFACLFAGLGLLALLLIKHRWPDLDIYRILDWLRATFPGFFGG